MPKSLTPDQIYPRLFVAVQQSGLFDDSKTFVDLLPTESSMVINETYENECKQPGFDLNVFIQRFFVEDELPNASQIAPAQTAVDHIQALWSVLKREADVESTGSRLPLAHPYIVPGGRFNEIYYWDSYFTQLGLADSGEIGLVRSMVNNFADMISDLGFIPNGNRTYFATRSQPPFFALMVELLASYEGDEIFTEYLPAMLREYAFWMQGADGLQPGEAHCRVVMTKWGALNRYWDDAKTPRQESYREDLETAETSHRPHQDVFRDLRAGAESGWDFSSRWFNGQTLDSIATTSILPVDLNALLVRVEQIIARASRLAGNHEVSDTFESAANQRSHIINHCFFNESLGVFTDVNWPSMQHRDAITLASAFPLFVGIASQSQAGLVAKTLESLLLKPGGWMTTNNDSGQQWDAPNGWAPLQWIVFQGLGRYGFKDLAHTGARRWIANLDAVYAKHGKMLEKYDVIDVGNIPGGGEYAVQDGFGWTNGIYLSLRSALND